VLLANEGCVSVRSEAHQVDRWIASRFARCLDSVEAAVAVYDFTAAVDALYHFVWDEFCDWYLELAKVRLYSDDEAERREAGGHARWMLDQIVRLLHPFLPYVTEEVAAQYGAAPLLAQAHPRRNEFAVAEDDEAALADVQGLVNALRAFRAEGGVAPGQVLGAAFVGETPYAAARYAPYAAAIRALARTEVRFEGAPDSGATVVLVPGGRLEVASRVDVAEEIARLEAQLARAEAEVGRCAAKLANEAFVGKAPEPIVAKEREKLAGYTADRDELAARLAKLRQG
jgi:valyl-tRNA synthetase